MLLENIVVVVIALAIGDCMAFSIHRLCLIFDGKSETFLSKKTLYDYIEFIFEQFKKNRSNFIAYSIILYSLSIISTYYCYKHFGLSYKAIFALIFAYAMIILSFVDARTGYLPDIITKPLIVIGLVQGYFGFFTDLNSSVIGTLAGYLSLWGINSTFKMVRGIDGMGYGDFKLLCAIGAYVGWYQLPFVVLASSIIGILVAVGLAKLGKNKLSSPSPFGPSLAIAGIVSLFWGNQIISWYITFFLLAG